MNVDNLKNTAKLMVQKGKGILQLMRVHRRVKI